MTQERAPFDVAGVPPFPVLVVQVNHADGHYAVTLDGRPLDLDSQVDITDAAAVSDAAMTETGKVIGSRGWNACRVTAIDPDGTKWPMVVTSSDGERYSLEDDAEAEGAGGRRPWLWPAVAIAGALALSAGGFGIALAYRSAPAPVAAAPTPSATPTEMPTIAPAGSSTHARWGFGPVADSRPVALLPSGDIAVVQAGEGNTRHLTIVDQKTGHARWTTVLASGAADGPWVTKVGAKTAIMTASTTTITWWAVDDLTTPHVVQLTKGSKLTVTSDGAWVTVGQHAYVIDETELDHRIIPAGAKVMGLQGKGLVALDSIGNQWLLDRDLAQTPTPRRLAAPAAGYSFSSTVAWHAGTTAALWRNKTAAILTFHDSTGKVVAKSSVPGLGMVNQGEPRPYALAGTQVISLDKKALVPLPAGFRPRKIVGNFVFGTASSPGRADDAATFDLTTRKAAVVRRSTTPPIPAAVFSDGTPLVLARDGSQKTVAYRLEKEGA